MELEERVRHLFGVNIEAKIAVADTLAPMIAAAGQRLAHCLLNDGKILICGSGGSAANCLHFSMALLNHFEVERPPLPVIALTTDVSFISAMANEGHYDQVFARQIQALGQSADVLIALSTVGHSDSLLNALHTAHDKGMDAIILSGGDGGVLANHLGPDDIELRSNSDNVSQIHQMHLLILHCFCDLIDQSLFGQVCA